ncbi:glycosyltransferase family 4 protein [Undibacterium sp.]|uniref:glycosyltransferase family 4 protein n=1 Tax=Undibacterium sp. TaxID=1914977 RepID=UPI00375155F3
MTTNSILLVAYQCGPGMGSVSQIGWEWFVRLGVNHKLTLVTHERNRSAISSNENSQSREIIYIDTEWFAGPLYRCAKRLFPTSEHSVFLISSLDYFLFDLIAYFKLKRALKAGADWQLTHRVTPVTLAAPTWLGRLGIPLLVGPLNSGLGSPAGFDRILKRESVWLIQLRKIGSLFDHVIGSTKRVARMLIATKTTLQAVASKHQVRCHMMLENGVNLDHFSMSAWPNNPSQSNPLRVLFVGRLIPLKGVDMLIEAICAMKKNNLAVHVDIIGDGPMLSEWTALVAHHKLSDQVKFLGAQDSNAVASAMHGCHVLCLPSVRESGGAVLLEAMSCGRPVIALNYGGPSEIINESIGALIPMQTPEQVIQDLEKTLTDIIASPSQWQKKGCAARQATEDHYSWNAKIDAIESHYQALIERKLNHV